MDHSSPSESTASKLAFDRFCNRQFTTQRKETFGIEYHPARKRLTLAIPLRLIILLVSLFTMASVIATSSASSTRFIGLMATRKFSTVAFLARWNVRKVCPCVSQRSLQPNQAGRTQRNWLYSSSTSQPDSEKTRIEKDAFQIRLEIPTPQDMEDIGAVLSMGTGPGDVILLGGDLGAGKTTLSRGFVRTRTGAIDMRVTSPTYLLSNTYEADGGETIIHHMDLYRLSGNDDDLSPLDMEHVFTKCISLVEWPSRLGDSTPPIRLDVDFRIDIDDEGSDDESKTRYLTLQAHGSVWEDRLKLLVDEGYIDDLLLEEGADEFRQ